MPNPPAELAPVVARMPVVILCGGKGTRLAEETDLRPKPMVEVGGRPILWHIMKYYAAFGFRRFVLPLGYRGDFIKRYFLDYALMTSDFTLPMRGGQAPALHRHGDEADWEVTCVDTGEENLKGSRVKQIEPYVGTDSFMLTYGDGVCNVDLHGLLRFHLAHDATGTVTGVRPPSRFGEIRLDGDRVLAFEEKPQLSTAVINGGFFVFRRALFDRLTPDAACDLEFGPLQELAAQGQLRVFRHDGFWQCMDNIRETRYLRQLWERDEAPWRIWDKEDRP